MLVTKAMNQSRDDAAAALDLHAENARLAAAIEAERAARAAAERRADLYEAQLVERWLAARPGRYSAEEQAWIRNNRRYVLDPDFHNRVVRAHHEAAGELKLPHGSPEYFAHLEKRGYLRERHRNGGSVAE
jgi:hypothetical protein